LAKAGIHLVFCSPEYQPPAFANTMLAVGGAIRKYPLTFASFLLQFLFSLCRQVPEVSLFCYLQPGVEYFQINSVEILLIAKVSIKSDKNVKSIEDN
jgi:hypothetical protein